MPFSEVAYGPAFAELLQIDRLRVLDEGSPDEGVRQKLEALTAELAFSHTQVVDPDAARCCLSAIWLLHDFLDESHTISQDIPTAEGSFWHGIMHRREGDFSNAKYWFRKVGEHPVYHELSVELTIAADAWDPFLFVDACQKAVQRGDDIERCQQLQQREWELLFDYCYRVAVGA